jgi:hypothetical protein
MCLAMLILAAPLWADEASGREDPRAVRLEDGGAGRGQSAEDRAPAAALPDKPDTGRVKAAGDSGVSFQYDALGRAVVIERGQNGQ